MEESNLISRQAAIEALSTPHGILYPIRTIESLPSAQPEQRWIPCSEKLPEEFDVLCCDNYGEMLIANPFECDDSDTGFSAESDECYMYNCIAWMPLPEPYQEGEQNG